MAIKHLFKIKLNWFNKEQREHTTKVYTKSHHITSTGKAELNISAAKAFKGDPTLYNPEDLLLSSVSSCHMMSYLYVCEKHNIHIISYEDQAEGILETHSNGSGNFSEIHLNPKIVIANEQQIYLATQLHQKANELCFIANSCNFPIYHHPVITSLES